MSDQLPYLTVTAPDGESFDVIIDKERVTIGRLPQRNDIALQPDPQQLVTRVAHCVIEWDNGWWVVDNNSVNKTFVQWDDTMKVVQGRASINDEDVIRILGRLSDTDEACYWELTFHDPAKTFQAGEIPLDGYLTYDWVQAKLFIVEGRFRREVKKLPPQVHKLVRYMDQRNKANNYSAVMCTFDELIEVVWEEDRFNHTEADINRLAWELRSKIERDSSEPQYLQNVKGLGYRLVTQPPR